MSTQDVYSKGLEDVVAGESSICVIDGKNSKLSYRGYDIHDLALNSNFEETAYLLLFGELPSPKALSDFGAQLAAERKLPEAFLKHLEAFPKQANTMAALRSAVSALSFYDPEAEDKSREANVRKSVRLIARTPVIISFLERRRKGLPAVSLREDARNAGTASEFLWLLKGRQAREIEARMLDKYFVLLAEHDFNASTFAAMVTAATTSDIYSAVVSAIGTLKGDLHGSANSRAMESILSIADVSTVESYVDDTLLNKKKLMGFGHRVYKGPDPRADDLRVMARALAEANKEQAKWFAISEKLEKAVWDRKKLYCNVDFYSASVLYTVGIPVDLFTAMFAVSRMAGWTAHVLEQYTDNRLIRPVSRYTGPASRPYIPVSKRGWFALN